MTIIIWQIKKKIRTINKMSINRRKDRLLMINMLLFNVSVPKR